jgi:hypothetical protein
MKNKRKQLGKLRFKKIIVAGLGTDSVKGGFGSSWNGCPTFPGEPCFTEIGCGTGGGGTTGGGGSDPVYTNGCPVITNNCASESVCPRGVYCY